MDLYDSGMRWEQVLSVIHRLGHYDRVHVTNSMLAIAERPDRARAAI